MPPQDEEWTGKFDDRPSLGSFTPLSPLHDQQHQQQYRSPTPEQRAGVQTWERVRGRRATHNAAAARVAVVSGLSSGSSSPTSRSERAALDRRRESSVLLRHFRHSTRVMIPQAEIHGRLAAARLGAKAPPSSSLSQKEGSGCTSSSVVPLAGSDSRSVELTEQGVRERCKNSNGDGNVNEELIEKGGEHSATGDILSLLKSQDFIDDSAGDNITRSTSSSTCEIDGARHRSGRLEQAGRRSSSSLRALWRWVTRGGGRSSNGGGVITTAALTPAPPLPRHQQQQQQMPNPPLVIAALCFWYFSSMSLTALNKCLFDRLNFAYPLLATFIHFAVIAIILQLVFHYQHSRPPDDPHVPFQTVPTSNNSSNPLDDNNARASQTLTTLPAAPSNTISAIGCDSASLMRPYVSRASYWKCIVPISFFGACEIALSNLAYAMVSLSLMTVIKSSLVVVTYVLSVCCGLERFRATAFGIVLFIVGSISLCVPGLEVKRPLGVVMLLVAVLMAGARWVIVHHQLQRQHYSSLQLLFLTQPLAALFLAVPALGFDLTHLVQTQASTPDTSKLYAASVIIVGSLALAFLVVFSEYSLVKLTSSVSLTVAGIGKEIATILMSVVAFGETIDLIPGIGIACSIVGIICYSRSRLYLMTEDEAQLHSIDEAAPLDNNDAAPSKIDNVGKDIVDVSDLSTSPTAATPAVLIPVDGGCEDTLLDDSSSSDSLFTDIEDENIIDDFEEGSKKKKKSLKHCVKINLSPTDSANFSLSTSSSPSLIRGATPASPPTP